jgi:hypothetical protein
VEWKLNITAKEVIESCLGETQTQTIESELKDNSQEIMVSWWHKPSGKTSEIGGVGITRWEIDDDSVITINYENQNTTQPQIDESLEWTLKQRT